MIRAQAQSYRRGLEMFQRKLASGSKPRYKLVKSGYMGLTDCRSFFGRGVVSDILLQNLSGDLEVNVTVFKVPYMLT